MFRIERKGNFSEGSLLRIEHLINSNPNPNPNPNHNHNHNHNPTLTTIYTNRRHSKSHIVPIANYRMANQYRYIRPQNPFSATPGYLRFELLPTFNALDEAIF